MSRPTFATAFLRWRACGWRRPPTRENRDGALRHLRLIRLILINEPHDIGHLQNRAQFLKQNVSSLDCRCLELSPSLWRVLDEFVPAGAPVGMIVNPKMPDTEPQVQSADAAARAKGHSLAVVRASSEDELNTAFAALAEHHVAGILAVSDAFPNSRRDQIVTLAARYLIPMMYPFRADAAAGGLLSCGTNIDEVYRQAGIYAGRILNGDKPGELPIQQPTKFDLVLNLKTARTLGITFPPTLLARADEVIE